MDTRTLHGHHFNLQEMIWAVLFTQDFLQLKGECARSISFSFVSDLFISCQCCSYVYYGNLIFPSPTLFLCSLPISESTITLAAHSAVDADALNSISLRCCIGEGRREGGRGHVLRGRRIKGGNKRMRGVGWCTAGWQIQDCLHPFFSPWRILS